MSQIHVSTIGRFREALAQQPRLSGASVALPLTAAQSLPEHCVEGELIVLAPAIGPGHIAALAQALVQAGVTAQVVAAGHWHQHDLLRVQLSQWPEKAWCRAIGSELGLDLGLLAAPIPAQLVLFDMDSTLITMEVIDELANEAGSGVQVAAITEAAMRGELDFNASLVQRVATLKGLSLAAVEQVKQRLQCNAGVPEFAAMAHGLGVRLALVSGGFLPFARHIGTRLNFDYVRANTLLDDGAVLTGTVLGEIVNAEVKARTITELRTQYGCAESAVWAVGDGANDLLMLQAAHFGVAFRAKPKLRLAADLALDFSDMRGLAALQSSLLESIG